MAKDEVMRMEGKVIDVLPNAVFRVELTGSKETTTALTLICHLSGKMRKNNIRVLMGDRVDIEVSPYDLTKGRIAYRHK